MDTVTQIALGAAVGEAVLGRRVGARAPLWGAICGTIPDLDVLVPFADAVADFTYHRSFSHSLLVLAALTPLMVWLILRTHPQTRPWRGRWAVLVYLVFATHALLDAFTIYGTQLLWPLDTTPYGLGSVFIIDPLYTLPLLIGVGTALWLRHRPPGLRANAVGLGLSSLYLVWGLFAMDHVEDLARQALARDGHAFQRLLAQPTPFNSLVWRVVAVNADHYRVGYYSVFDETDHIDTFRIESQPELLEPLSGEWSVQRLRWFTRGFYSVDQVDDRVVMSDLRMGVEPDYVFRFVVGEISNPHPLPVAMTTRLSAERDFGRMRNLWQRLWDAEAGPI